MKHNSFIRAFIFSLCLTSIQAADVAAHEALLPRLRSENWPVRYDEAKEFSMLAEKAGNAGERQVIRGFIEPFLVEPHPLLYVGKQLKHFLYLLQDLPML